MYISLPTLFLRRRRRRRRKKKHTAIRKLKNGTAAPHVRSFLVSSYSSVFLGKQTKKKKTPSIVEDCFCPFLFRSLLLGIPGEAKFIGDMHLLSTRELGTGTPHDPRKLAMAIGDRMLGSTIFGGAKASTK